MANAIVTQRDTQLERQRAGYIQLSLTNFTNDDAPTIAAGSVVEISGTLYSVTTNESITEWAGISNGAAWIKLIPSGTDPFTAEYTATAPTWSDAEQGWYDGTGAHRYVAGLTKTGASGYAQKNILHDFSTFNTFIPGYRTFLDNISIADVPFELWRADFSGATEVVLTATNAAWPLPVGAEYFEVEGLGGGGGGGGSEGTSVTNRQTGAGGSGGSIGFTRFRRIPGVDTLNVVIGAAGTASADASGGTGGTTTVTYNSVVILQCPGGGGGVRRVNTPGATGSIATIGHHRLSGDPGSAGTLGGPGGAGGGSPYGGGGGGMNNTSGNAGTGRGTGGGGGNTVQDGGSFFATSGGVGTAGRVAIRHKETL